VKRGLKQTQHMLIVVSHAQFDVVVLVVLISVTCKPVNGATPMQS